MATEIKAPLKKQSEAPRRKRAARIKNVLVVDVEKFLGGETPRKACLVPPTCGDKFNNVMSFGGIKDGHTVKRTDEILAEMAVTFKERNAVYGDNYRMVAKLMAVLFPHGLPPDLFTKDQFHLFELIIVKLSRFAISNLTHRDSIHDAAVYAAMIEAVIYEQEANQ